MFANIVAVPKLNAPDSRDVLGLVSHSKLAAHELGINCEVYDPQKSYEGTTLYLALGGDGTMIHAMKLATQHGDDGYAYGINLGNVGFLTELGLREFPYFELYDTLIDLFKFDSMYYEERIVIETTEPYSLSVNEVSISQLYADAMITYSLRVDGQDAGIHKANSLLIATSTGSTAYALSAGGALMTPTLKALQLVPVAPIKLTARPIIVPHDAKIQVEVWGEGIAVRTDGQVLMRSSDVWTESNPFKLTLTSHNKFAKVLHKNGWNFFDVLAEKLGWMKK